MGGGLFQPVQMRQRMVDEVDHVRGAGDVAQTAPRRVAEVTEDVQGIDQIDRRLRRPQGKSGGHVGLGDHVEDLGVVARLDEAGGGGVDEGPQQVVGGAALDQDDAHAVSALLRIALR